jgi:hypothetical protein
VNLLSVLKKKQSGHISVAVSDATDATSPLTLLGDLTPLVKLVKPMRSRMAQYDHAIHALAVARERLRDLADAPVPQMTLAVEREIIVAMGDPEQLVRFDAENAETIKAERAAREATLRDRDELPARIKALETVVRRISEQMVGEEVVTDIDHEAQQVFAPYAQRVMAAAQHFADMMQEANTAVTVLNSALSIHEYNLFADLKRTHRPDLMGEVAKAEILPTTMASVSWEAIEQINLSLGRIKPDVEQQMNQELVAADLTGERLRFYYPCTENDHHKIYAPELTRRVNRPQQVANSVSTRVYINN